MKIFRLWLKLFKMCREGCKWKGKLSFPVDPNFYSLESRCEKLLCCFVAIATNRCMCVYVNVLYKYYVYVVFKVDHPTLVEQGEWGASRSALWPGQQASLGTSVQPGLPGHVSSSSIWETSASAFVLFSGFEAHRAENWVGAGHHLCSSGDLPNAHLNVHLQTPREASVLWFSAPDSMNTVLSMVEGISGRRIMEGKCFFPSHSLLTCCSYLLQKSVMWKELYWYLCWYNSYKKQKSQISLKKVILSISISKNVRTG